MPSCHYYLQNEILTFHKKDQHRDYIAARKTKISPVNTDGPVAIIGENQLTGLRNQLALQEQDFDIQQLLFHKWLVQTS
jgi:hypothetical protein